MINYEAFTDCEVYSIPRSDYLEFLQATPEVVYERFTDFVDRYLNFQMRINALEQSKPMLLLKSFPPL